MKRGDKPDLLLPERTCIVADDHETIALDLAPPSSGEMQKVADDLYWIRFTLPFRLNHINLFAFDTDDGWLLLDCGIKGEATTAQWRDLLNGPLARQPVSGIIVSHYHADHVGYAGALAARTGAPVYMGAVEYEQTQWGLGQSDSEYGAMMEATYQRFGLADNHITEARVTGNYYRFLVSDLPNVITVDDTYQFITKGGCWQIRFDAGHSPGHMSLTDRARKLHICVDFLLPRISPNISARLRDLNDDTLADYLRYLDSMTGTPADWLIIPGHDWPYFGGGARAKQLSAHHVARLDQLLDIIGDKPVSTNDAMLALFPFNMTGHEVFFASCEARAHLNHLVTSGHLQQQKSKNGMDIFIKS